MWESVSLLCRISSRRPPLHERDIVVFTTQGVSSLYIYIYRRETFSPLRGGSGRWPPPRPPVGTGAGAGSFQTQRLWLQRRIVLSDNVLIMSDNAWFTSENAFSCVIINEFMYYLCTGNERLRPRNALLMSDNAFSLKIMYEFIYLMCKATCEIYRQFSKLARTQGKSSKIIRKLCFFVKRRKGYQTIQLGGADQAGRPYHWGG